jgi:hypothetical protein
VRERQARKIEVVSDAIVEMYEDCFDNSMGEHYIAHRGVPKWAAKLWGLGYSDLTRSMVIPMLNTVSERVQDYMSLKFEGGYTDVLKLKPENAGAAVVVPKNYKAFENAVVVEGLIDAMKAGLAMWSQGILAVPVALSTVFPTAEQLKFVRRFNRVYLGFDHDEAGTKGRDVCRRAFRDKAFLYDLVYPEELKDPGELGIQHAVSVKLIL